MFSTKSPIKLYTWKSSKLNDDNPRVIIKNMDDINRGELEYDPENNVKQLARLFSISLPGNTVDLFYDEIAEALMPFVDDNVSFWDKEFISNHIRIAINLMLEKENKS